MNESTLPGRKHQEPESAEFLIHASSYLLDNQLFCTSFEVSSVISRELGEAGCGNNILSPQGRNWTRPSLCTSAGSECSDFVMLQFHDLNVPFSSTVNPLLLKSMNIFILHKVKID